MTYSNFPIETSGLFCSRAYSFYYIKQSFNFVQLLAIEKHRYRGKPFGQRLGSLGGLEPLQCDLRGRHTDQGEILHRARAGTWWGELLR